MGEKITYQPTPSSSSWENILLNLQLNIPTHFYNIDNTAQNGRQAIKRYYKKMEDNKLPHRRFSTGTSKVYHSFIITRIE